MFFCPSSYFCIAHGIKGYICTFSLMTDLTRCRWCWPRNSRWTQIRLSKHIVHSSRGGQRGDREGRGGQKGGQRGVLEEGNGHFLCSVLQQTDFLVRLAPLPDPARLTKIYQNAPQLFVIHCVTLFLIYQHILTTLRVHLFIGLCAMPFHQYFLTHIIWLVWLVDTNKLTAKFPQNAQYSQIKKPHWKCGKCFKSKRIADKNIFVCKWMLVRAHFWENWQ